MIVCNPRASSVRAQTPSKPTTLTLSIPVDGPQLISDEIRQPYRSFHLTLLNMISLYSNMVF